MRKISAIALIACLILMAGCKKEADTEEPVTCASPEDISVEYVSGTNYFVDWTYVEPDTAVFYYQLEWGPTGFNLGTGESVNVIESWFLITPVQGATYDCYVRTSCSMDEYSAWTGPYSFYAEF